MRLLPEGKPDGGRQDNRHLKRAYGEMKMRISRTFGIIIGIIICLLLAVSAQAERVVIPADTTVIEEQAFYGDGSVTDVDLPEGLRRIETKAFANTGLSSVTLPRSLEYFAQDAFDGCPEGFEINVYKNTKAAELCEEYEIPANIITGLEMIGISMPSDNYPRWTGDAALIKTTLENKGYNVELCYADNDSYLQQNQIKALADSGCEVIIVAAVDGNALGNALSYAAGKGAKIIAYDRPLINTLNVDYYITINNYNVGALQGNYVKQALNLDQAAGPFYVEFTAGDAGDENALLFFNGAMDILRPYINSGKLIVRSGQTTFDAVATRNWKEENAQSRARTSWTHIIQTTQEWTPGSAPMTVRRAASYARWNMIIPVLDGRS